MLLDIFNRITRFSKNNKGAAIIETSFILPILIFILIFFVEIHLLVQAKQGIMLLAEECARDFSVSGRVNSFQSNIQRLSNVLLGVDDALDIDHKLKWYIHMNSYMENISAYPIFFDVDGDGKFTDGVDEKVYDSFDLIENFSEPEMYIGSKKYTIWGKTFMIPSDPEYCFFDAADKWKSLNGMHPVRFGMIVFVYKFKFVFPLLKHLLMKSEAKLDYVPVVGKAVIIRDC